MTEDADASSGDRTISIFAMDAWRMSDWDNVIALVFTSITNITICAVVAWAGRTVARDESQGPEVLRNILALILMLGAMFLAVLNVAWTYRKAKSIGFGPTEVICWLALLALPASAIMAMQFKSLVYP